MSEKIYNPAIKTAFAVIGGLVGKYVGGFDNAFISLVIFMCVDYLTGLMCGIYKKELSSEIGFKGICKKVLIVLLVGLAALVDRVIPSDTAVFRDMVIFFYIANEGLSIIENACVLGLPIPEKFQKFLYQIKEKNDHEEQ